MMKKICKSAIAISMLVAGNAYAGTVTADVNALGLLGTPGYGLVSPSSVNWIFSATGGTGNLTFELAGYHTLDGDSNCCTDVFHLSVNSTEIFSGSWNLGGGGGNVIYFNPNSGTASPTLYGFNAGGIVDISVPISLLNGSNTVTFAYTGAYQGLGDEGWGVNSASVTTTATPIPAAIWFTGTALIGLCGFFRRNS